MQMKSLEARSLYSPGTPSAPHSLRLFLRAVALLAALVAPAAAQAQVTIQLVSLNNPQIINTTNNNGSISPPAEFAATVPPGTYSSGTWSITIDNNPWPGTSFCDLDFEIDLPPTPGSTPQGCQPLGTSFTLSASVTDAQLNLINAMADGKTKIPFDFGFPVTPSYTVDDFHLTLQGGTPPPSPILPPTPDDNSQARAPSGPAPFSPATGGTADADPVMLANGTLQSFTGPDLSSYNPNGLPAVYKRTFSSYLASRGYSSPGLPPGWIHNYDVRVQGPGYMFCWTPIVLYYPNGSFQYLSPVLDGSGAPTGAFNTPPGSPIIAQGVPATGLSGIGRWQSLTVTWSDGTKWYFTPQSGQDLYNLVQITNRMGYSINLNLDSSRRLTSVVDATGGRTLLTLAYGTNGYISSVTDAYSRMVTYTTGVPTGLAATDLLSVSQIVAVGARTIPARFTYGYVSSAGAQLLSADTVPSPTGTGVSTGIINYTNGAVSSQVDANNNQTLFTYSPGSTLVQVKDSAGDLVFSYTQNIDSQGRDIGVTDATGSSTHIVYGDPNNLTKPTSFTDRDGALTQRAYGPYGATTSVTTPRGVTVTTTYDYSTFPLGRAISVQEGSKPPTTYTYYEPSGLTHTITSPPPGTTNSAQTVTTTFTYDALGNTLTVTAPAANSIASATRTTTFNYTTDGAYSQAAAAGQPLTITDGAGKTQHLRYNSQGTTSSVVTPLGYETDFTYDIANHILTTTYPATGQNGRGRSYTQNAYLYPDGPVTSVSSYDESGKLVRQVTYTYGPEGELKSSSGAANDSSVTYDAAYRRSTLSDGLGHVTAFSYSPSGSLAAVSYPGHNGVYDTLQFTSDPDGNVIKRIDGRGLEADFAYADPENLLTDITYPATPSLNVHKTYDGYGRLATVSDGSGAVTYTYDDLDETLTAQTTYTGLPPQTISYGYYPDGHRQNMTTPAGAFQYSYDANARLASLQNPLNEVFNWTYQDDGRVSTRQLPNGVEALYTFNPRGFLTDLANKTGGGTTLSDFGSMVYDGAGALTSLATNIPGYSTYGGTTTYTYSASGQLTQEKSGRNGGYTSKFAYDLAGNPSTFRGATRTFNVDNQNQAFTFDGDGNPVTYNGVALSFGPEDQLAAYGSALTAGYDAEGRRAWKQNAAGTTYFLYDGMSPVCELSSAGAITAINTFGGDGLLSRNTSSGSVFYTFDPQGSVSETLNSAGSVLSASMFDAYGANLAGGSGPFGFAAQYGYYLDPESGLYLLGHRYYDSSQGRFLNRDPSGYDGGLNLYGYASQDPVNLADPLGLSPSLFGTICRIGLPLSRFENKFLLFDAGSHMGTTWAAYDDGRASGLELVGAGAMLATAEVAEVGDGLEDLLLDGSKVVADKVLGEELGDAAEEASGGVYKLVTKDEERTVMRTGRTNNLVRRKAEQELAYPNLNFEVIGKTDDYATQRGLEQMAHDQYAETAVLNRIRAISPTNPNLQVYLNAGLDFFVRNGLHW